MELHRRYQQFIRSVLVFLQVCTYTSAAQHAKSFEFPSNHCQSHLTLIQTNSLVYFTCTPYLLFLLFSSLSFLSSLFFFISDPLLLHLLLHILLLFLIFILFNVSAGHIPHTTVWLEDCSLYPPYPCQYLSFDSFHSSNILAN